MTRVDGGSIPAWAGQPLDFIANDYARGVYPRVGGATGCPAGCAGAGQGLSPRGRGNRLPARQSVEMRRSIPAWAGQPPRLPNPQLRSKVYPRVGGATCTPQQVKDGLAGLSPRGRGNRPEGYPLRDMPRSIPAWAGQPDMPLEHEQHGEVYPRVGGATTCPPFLLPRSPGLSPRGRGNRCK